MEVKKADLSSLRIKRDEGNEGKGGNNIRKILIIVATVLIVAAASYFIYTKLSEKEMVIVTATAAMTSEAQSNAILTGTGYVVAQRKAAVASKGTGRLQFLGVVEGDRVQKDQIIARLEDSDIKAQLEQARANLKLTQADVKEAENTYNRQQALFATKSATQAEVDAAEARYQRVVAAIDLAKAQVTAAEVALENMLIRAPFAGTVLTKNADVGEIVAPFAASVSAKAAVVTLADMSSLEVEADVSESNIERIKGNQECEITLDAYPDRRYPGFVAKIVPTADRSKATVMVKIGFKSYDSRVLPEMSAKVLFLGEGSSVSTGESKSFLTVPSTAVIAKDGKHYVYIASGSTLLQREVSTGKIAGGLTEIISGLQPGDKVAREANPAFKDGMKFKEE